MCRLAAGNTQLSSVVLSTSCLYCWLVAHHLCQVYYHPLEKSESNMYITLAHYFFPGARELDNSLNNRQHKSGVEVSSWPLGQRKFVVLPAQIEVVLHAGLSPLCPLPPLMLNRALRTLLRSTIVYCGLPHDN